MNKRRALAAVEQAGLLRRNGQWAEMIAVLEPVVAHPDLAPPPAHLALADALSQLGRPDDARAALETGLKKHRHDPTLESRLGSLLVDLGEAAEGLKLIERHFNVLGRDPAYLNHLALAQLRGGKSEAAEGNAEAALKRGGGEQSRLVLAMVKARRGRFEQARALVEVVEAKSVEPTQRHAARAMHADCLLFLGDAAGALTRWQQLEAEGALMPSQLGHMAYAAQLAGNGELADQLVQRRSAQTPSAEDRLLFAHIANLRAQPAQALEHLALAESAAGERFAGYGYEVLSARGRALRLLGRAVEAGEALAAATLLPEHQVSRLGSRVRIDLGHLAAEQGDFRAAEAAFREALGNDPQNPEATRALELNARRMVWRTEVFASADARVDAARAEAEALKRHVSSREGELEALKAELEQIKAERARAEAQAALAQVEAKAATERARQEQREKLREELEARESEIVAKATDEIVRALGPTRAACPEALLKLLMVSERTYQKAMYTELPVAAVAVLYSGALERGLFILFVERFEKWLDGRGRRAAFLEGAVRERRGHRVEYFDHFVEAFDHERAGRAPSLGEVGRVLERRHESYLKPFHDYLTDRYAPADGFYGELATFVQWSKQKLRDPAAHGRGIELGHDELKTFREKLLFSFGSYQRGVLPLLLAEKTP